jgi:hypothetical protein
MKTKRYTVLLLALSMLAAMLSGCGSDESEETQSTPEPTAHTEYELTDNAVSKEETVYINVSPDGEVKKISVTDRLHTDMPQVRVEDKSNLEDIQDVKTFTEPVEQDGKLYWDMDSTDLYYSGTTENTPPMKISVSYTLDGKEVKGSSLAGKSGDVTITIKAENTLTKSVSASGGTYDIACPMLFVCGMILPDENFSEVSTSDGVLLSDGSRQLVFFAGVPGMNESLGLDKLGVSIGTTLGGGEYTVTAKASDFKLGNMMFVAVPFSSISSLGPDDIKVGTESVKSMLSDIQSLMGAFSSLNLSDMIQLLYGDAQQIEQLVSSVGKAAKLYKENKALIDVLNKYVTEGNLEKLENLLTDMQNIDTSRLQSLAQFTRLSELLELLGKFNTNIGALAQFTRDYLELAPTFESLNEDLSSAEVQKSLDNLPTIISELQNLVDVMHQSEDMLERMSSVLSGESLNKIIEFTQKLENSISIETLTQAQQQSLTERMQAWLDFGNSYDIFTQRTDKMTSTVVFVYKSESIG